MARRNRRLEIMQAAEKLFTSHRFHEITLDDVTREAGVGKGTIYRYFHDKDDLFFQTAVGGFDELCELIETSVDGKAAFAAQLLRACEKIGAFFQRRRALFRMMQSEESRMHWCKGELREQWHAHREKLASAVAGVLQRGVKDGAVRADVAPQVLAGILLGMLRTHARDLAGSPPEERSLRIIVDLFLQGAGADRPRRRAPRKTPRPSKPRTGGSA